MTVNNIPPDKPDESVDLPARSWVTPSPLTVAIAVAALVGSILFAGQCSGQ
jgi:hypothetical protein